MKDLLIKIPECAHKGFLDREKVVGCVTQQLKPWCDLIEDIVNYGSNLIPRCFVSSERGLKDAVVLAILLRQVVAMLDGVQILLAHGSCYVAQLPMRALFESCTYIDWILQSDSERKSLYYYVHNLRRKRLSAQRVQADSAESQKFMLVMEEAGVKLNENVVQLSRKQLKGIERVLSQPRFADVSADFDRFSSKGKRERPWYFPLGPRSFKSVAEAVHKLPHYMIFYSTASQAMHGSSYENHIAIGKGEITFQPIRSLEGFTNVLRPSIADALGTYRGVLKEYRPAELPDFSRKYMEKWRRDFLNMPNIKINVDPINI